MFNDGRYYERCLAGEFLMCLRHEGVAASVDEPVNTRSLVLEYLDLHGVRVCRVHMYLRPDGTIGGSRQPDPKQIIVDGCKYVVG